MANIKNCRKKVRVQTGRKENGNENPGGSWLIGWQYSEKAQLAPHVISYHYFFSRAALR